MELTRVRRIAAVGALGIALAATSVVATTGVAAAKSTAAKTCAQKTDDRWPARVHGRPAGIDPNTTAATYMWHDSSGWHIRVTHRTTNLKSFSGQLTTTGTFVNAKPVRLEKNDTFVVSADKHTVTFLFKNYGKIDGVNFMHALCAEHQVRLPVGWSRNAGQPHRDGQEQRAPEAQPVHGRSLVTFTTVTHTSCAADPGGYHAGISSRCCGARVLRARDDPLLAHGGDLRDHECDHGHERRREERAVGHVQAASVPRS